MHHVRETTNGRLWVSSPQWLASILMGHESACRASSVLLSRYFARSFERQLRQIRGVLMAQSSLFNYSCSFHTSTFALFLATLRFRRWHWVAFVERFQSGRMRQNSRWSTFRDNGVASFSDVGRRASETQKNLKINDIAMSFRKAVRKNRSKTFSIWWNEKPEQLGGSEAEKAVPTAVPFIILVCQGRDERVKLETLSLSTAGLDWFRSMLTKNSFYLKLSITFILRNGSIWTAFLWDSAAVSR